MTRRILVFTTHELDWKRVTNDANASISSWTITDSSFVEAAKDSAAIAFVATRESFAATYLSESDVVAWHESEIVKPDPGWRVRRFHHIAGDETWRLLSVVVDKIATRSGHDARKALDDLGEFLYDKADRFRERVVEILELLWCDPEHWQGNSRTISERVMRQAQALSQEFLTGDTATIRQTLELARHATNRWGTETLVTLRDHLLGSDASPELLIERSPS